MASTIAIAACAVLVFALGMLTGIYALRAELRRNGWRVRLQVDEPMSLSYNVISGMSAPNEQRARIERETERLRRSENPGVQ